jgi:hypothetical protein
VLVSRFGGHFAILERIAVTKKLRKSPDCSNSTPSCREAGENKGQVRIDRRGRIRIPAHLLKFVNHTPILNALPLGEPKTVLLCRPGRRLNSNLLERQLAVVVERDYLAVDYGVTRQLTKPLSTGWKHRITPRRFISSYTAQSRRWSLPNPGGQSVRLSYGSINEPGVVHAAR